MFVMNIIPVFEVKSTGFSNTLMYIFLLTTQLGEESWPTIVSRVVKHGMIMTLCMVKDHLNAVTELSRNQTRDI